MLLAVVACLFSAGCEELEARRLVQKADGLYLEGRADQAVELYEEALAKKPDLVVGRHNAALAYYQLFKPGEEGEQNLGYAKKAAEHLQTYLEAEPSDTDIQRLLTQTWEDSGQVESALSFWEKKLESNPTSRDIINQLAAVNINAGRIQGGLEWLWKLASVEKESAGKLQAYLTIGRTCMGRLARADLVDFDRLNLADQGIAALQKALALEPIDKSKHKDIHGALNAIFQRRALAHGASWARLLDLSAARVHFTKYRELEAELKKAAPAPAAGKGDEDSAEKEAAE